MYYCTPLEKASASTNTCAQNLLSETFTTGTFTAGNPPYIISLLNSSIIDGALGFSHKKGMKKEIPEIRESLPELSVCLRHERGAHRRTRLQVLYLLKSGQARTRQEVATLVAVHRHTIGRWLDSYEHGGLGALLAVHTHSNRRPILSATVRQALKRKLQDVQGFITYGQVQQWLRKQHGVSSKYKTLHRLVRYKFQATLKVLRASHVKKTPRRPRRSALPLGRGSSTLGTSRGQA